MLKDYIWPICLKPDSAVKQLKCIENVCECVREKDLSFIHTCIHVQAAQIKNGL